MLFISNGSAAICASVISASPAQDFVAGHFLSAGAVDGLGLTFSFEDYVASQIGSGALERVLEDWCPPFHGYFLYYPSRRQQSAALSALIEALRM